MKVTFALALVGPSDDLLIRVFDSEEDLRRFVAVNPPAPVNGKNRVTEGPLFDAANVRGLGPADSPWYSATKLEDGVPVAQYSFYVDDDEPFDPTVPLFYVSNLE